MAARQDRQQTDLETIRIPLLGSPGNRASDSSKDQRFVNGYFWEIKNPLTGKAAYFFVKRFGTSQYSYPPGATAVGRGIYSWKGSVYTVFGSKIWKGAVDLGVTLSTTTGLCGFAETRPGAATQYLGVNDGISLYLITTSGSVVVLNNKAITSSSIANPSTITSTAHGLATGNQIIIRGHTGMIPELNGTVYTITKTGADTFTVPVNVTTGGTTGTIGVFPSPNSTDLVYADGYFLVFKTASLGIFNCELDDPTDWDPSKFITPQMFNGVGVGIAKQNNLVLAFSDKSLQAFYDNANASGSPFSNYESAVQQIGARSTNSITSDESLVTWVGNSYTGGHTVWNLEGITGLKEIADTRTRLLLDAEGASISSIRARFIRHSGKKFYTLTLASANRTLVYDYDLEIWTEFEATTAATSWPIIATTEFGDVLLAQHTTNGRVYTVSSAIYQDDSVNFAVLARFGRLDLDTSKRKFVKNYTLIGDKQASTANVSFQYSDDDYVTLSTARTFDSSLAFPFLPRGGNFRRRAHQLSYSGNLPARWEALEMEYREGGK